MLSHTGALAGPDSAVSVGFRSWHCLGQVDDMPAGVSFFFGPCTQVQCQGSPVIRAGKGWRGRRELAPRCSATQLGAFRRVAGQTPSCSQSSVPSTPPTHHPPTKTHPPLPPPPSPSLTKNKTNRKKTSEVMSTAHPSLAVVAEHVESLLGSCLCGVSVCVIVTLTSWPIDSVWCSGNVVGSQHAWLHDPNTPRVQLHLHTPSH